MKIITRSTSGGPFKSLKCDICGTQSKPIATTEDETGSDRGLPAEWGRRLEGRMLRDFCPPCTEKYDEASNAAARAADNIVPPPYNEKTDLACRAAHIVLGPTYTRDSGRFELFRKAYDRLSIDVLLATVNALERKR